MNAGKRMLALAGAVFVLFACGCYRSPWITLYEAHEYKGSDDPLLNELQKPELQDQLQKRLTMVQTDR